MSEQAGPHERKKAQANMACEICRKRKSKCDEKRPRCGLCERLDLLCTYQTPKPTKKDETLMQILQTLNSLNQRIDQVLLPEESLHLVNTSNICSAETGAGTEGDKSNAFVAETAPNDIDTGASSQDMPVLDPSFNVPVRPSTDMHNILAWPAIQSLLECDHANLSFWDGQYQSAERWLAELSADVPKLVIHQAVNIRYSEYGVLVLEGGRLMNLDKRYVEGLSAAFFQSFHCLYPILESRHFYTSLLPQACDQSFSEEHEESALVLLVFALGSVAQEAVTGRSFVDEAGRETGIRGGTVSHPPGHIFLTEARRRLGLALTCWDLTSLQCSILFAIYYAQVSRNLEFWHMAKLACMICKSLVERVASWDTVESDQVARCFWICCIFEGGLDSELGLGTSGVTALQDSVPFPVFLSDFEHHHPKHNDALFIEYHFLAQITLRTLIDRASEVIKEDERTYYAYEQGEKPFGVVAKELSGQLRNWRAHLPQAIAWDDDCVDEKEITSSYLTDHRVATTLFDPTSTGMLNFKTTLNASLRTRYKYAEYIIWRPYIFRVLHSPHDPSLHDVNNCWKALKACTLWPLTFSTFHSQRRLIPHIYEYTHTLFGILLLLHICSFDPFLGPLLESTTDVAARELTTSLCLSWIRDMRIVHPLARWCWQLLKIVYRDHDLTKEIEEKTVEI